MPEIVEQLYNDYYVDNKTPEKFYSSYWKFWHSQSKVKLNKGKVSKIDGVGFGELQARSWANHFLSWLSIQAHLKQLPNHQELRSLIQVGIPLAKSMGLKFTNDCFRQVCVFALIRSKLKTDSPRVLIIGDGYGFLSGLIKKMLPEAKLCLIDLGKTLFFQALDLQKAFPQAKHFLASENKVAASSQGGIDFVYCPAQCLEMIDDMSFDLAINVCSMQEMNDETVRTYFQFLRSHLVQDNLFYCCNRLERKMEGGEVSRFYSYPWDAQDTHYVDEACPWNQFFMAVHPAKNGPKVFNVIRVPWISYYDGPINHRLTKMHVSR